ncbi:MAG TPA: GTP-binding protein, partial [Acidimicrobiales bacterium]|nr:GTP-binding protein [Acidimicrobiales bacterium]
MKRFPPEKIRNVALVGHGGSGKTTLAEALLHKAGAITRMGRVEDGTTVCDFDPEEQKRSLSLSLALAPFEWKDHKVNLIDCPGYADFIGDVHAALRVADLAVFVVSAVEGVEVQTYAAWKIAAELGVPRMIFVNKLDRERASFERTLEQLRDRFGAGVAPLELPIGEEADFHGVADLLTDTAYLYDGDKVTHGEVPDELADLEHQVHDNLVEGIVVADDDLLERYLGGEQISFDELETCLAHGVASASVFPVVCGSATGPIAVDRLCDFICEIGPSPIDRPPVEVRAGDQTAEV